MAKRRDDYDFEDDDSLDFGNDFEDAFGGFDEEETPKKRNPVARLGGKMVGGIKDTFFSRQMQRELLSKNAPDGYTTIYDTLDSGLNASKDLYNTAKEGAGKSVDELKKGAKILSKEVGDNRLGRMLGRWGESGQSMGNGPEMDRDEMELASIMGSIFQEQQEQRFSDEPSSVRESISDELQEEQTRSTVQSTMQLGAMTGEISKLRINSDRMISYQDQVTTNYRKKMMEISIRHYLTSRKTTDLTKQHLEMSKSAFEKLVHNTNLPDILKMHNLELGHQMLKEKFFGSAISGFNDRFGNVGQRIINKSQKEIRRFFNDFGAAISTGVMGLQDAADNFGSSADKSMGGDGYSDLAASLAGGAIASKAGKWVGDKIGGRLKNNERLMQYGMAGQNFISNTARMFNEGLTSDTGNPFLEFIKYTGFFDEFRYRQDDTLRTDATAELDRATSFDIQTKKSITEVIPKLLSKIYGEVRSSRITWGGEEPDEIQYSFKTGTFTTSSKMESEIKEAIIGEKQLKNAAVAVNKVMERVDPDGVLSQPASDALKKYFIARARQGRDYALIRLARGDADGFRVPAEILAEVSSHLKNRFDFTEAQLDMAGNGLVGEMKAMAKGGLGQQEAMKNFLDDARGLTVELNGASKKKALDYTRSGNIEQLLKLGIAKQDAESGRLDLNSDYIDQMIAEQSLTAGNKSEAEVKKDEENVKRIESLQRALKGDSEMARKLARKLEISRAKSKKERDEIVERHKQEDIDAGKTEDKVDDTLYDTGLAWFNNNILSRAGIGQIDPKKRIEELKAKAYEQLKQKGITPDSEEGQRRLRDLGERIGSWIDSADDVIGEMDSAENDKLGTFLSRGRNASRAIGRELREIWQAGKSDEELAQEELGRADPDPTVVNEETPKAGQNHTGGIVGDKSNRQVGMPSALQQIYRYHTGGIAGDMPDVEVRKGEKKGEWITTAPDGTIVTWKVNTRLNQNEAKRRVLKKHHERYSDREANELKENEVPTILERDEEVLTADDPRHRNNIADTVSTEDGKSSLIDKLLSRIKDVGGLRQKAKSAISKVRKDGLIKSAKDWVSGKWEDVKRAFSDDEPTPEPTYSPVQGQSKVDGRSLIFRGDAPKNFSPSLPTDREVSIYDHVSYMRTGMDEMVELLKMLNEKTWNAEDKPGLISRAWNWSKEKTKGIGRGLKRGYQQFTDKVAKGMSSLRKVFPKLGDKLGQAKDWVTDKFSRLKNADYKGIKDSITGVAKSKFDQARDWMRGRAPKIMEGVKSLKDKIADKLPSMEKVKEGFGKGRDWVTQKAKGLMSKVPGLGAMAKRTIDRLNPFKSHVYVTGEKDLVITHEQLKSGALIDSNSFMRVNSLQDITGPVIDQEGNIVVTYQQYEKGLYLGSMSKRLKDMAANTLGRVKDMLTSPLQSLKNLRTKVKTFFHSDVYLKGTDQVLLTARGIAAEHYTDVKSGTLVTDINDITGPVSDQNGNLAVTQEQFDQGLESKDGFVKGTAKKLIRFGVNTAKSLLGFVAGDVCVEGEIEPVLTVKQMKSGEYTDQLTGNVVKSIKDITGPVVDANGNQVITAEQFEKGLYDRLTWMRPMANKVKGAIGGLIDRVKNFKIFSGLKDKVDTFFNDRTRATDVYVKGEEKPRLTFIGMVSGKYFNADGTACINLATASLPIKDERGNVLLDEEAAKLGLVDGTGKSLIIGKAALGLQIGRDLSKRFGGVTEKLGKAAKFAGKVLDKAWGIVSFRGVRNWLKGRKGGGLSQADVATMNDPLDVAKATLSNVVAIREMLDRSGKPKKNAFNDRDGDGVRDGSVEDQRRKGLLGRAKDWMKDKKDAVVDKVKEKGSGLFDKIKDMIPGGLLKGLGGAGLGALLMNTMVGDGEFSMLKTLTGGALGAAAPFALGAAGNALGGLAGKGAGAVGNMAKAGGRMALEGGKKAIPWLARSALPAILSGAGSLAGMAGTAAAGIGAVITAPIALAVGAVALAVGGGYLLYKHFTQKKSPVAKLRMAQYGFELDDESHVAKILEMEKKLLGSTLATGGKAKIQPGVEAEEFLKLFEVDMEDKEEMTNWLKWFHYRFKPVYLSHVTALYKTTRKTDLHKADELMGRTEKLAYLKAVHYKNGKASPYAVEADPFNEWHLFGGLLDVEDVNDVYEDAVEMAEEEAEKSGQSSSADKAAADKPVDKKSEADATRKKQEDAIKKEAMEEDSFLKNAWQFVKDWNPAAAPLTAAKSLMEGFNNPYADEQGLLNKIGAGARDMTNALGITSTAASLNKKQSEYQMMVFNAFKNAGFSDNQARAMTAEVGRENDYVEKYLFGMHVDPKNKSINQGFFSWQGSRRDKLFARMAAAGLVDGKGNFVPGQEALNQMALFAKEEINTSYSKTRDRFLSKPNIDMESAAQVLGRDYIRWAIDNPKYSEKGQKRRRSHLAALDRQLGTQKFGDKFTAAATAPAATAPAATAAATPAAAATASPTPSSPTGSTPSSSGSTTTAGATTTATTPANGNRATQGTPPEKAAAFATSRAQARSTGACARYVSDALASAGYRLGRGHASTYIEKNLLPNGFKMIAWGSSPQVGDLVHWSATSKHPYGHIQIWNGSKWVSDFVQNRISPWVNSDGSKGTHWRDGRYMAGSPAIEYRQGVGSTNVAPMTTPVTPTTRQAAAGRNVSPMQPEASNSVVAPSMPNMMTPNTATRPATQPKPVSDTMAKNSAELLDVNRQMLTTIGKLHMEQAKTNELLGKMLERGNGNPKKPSAETRGGSKEIPSTPLPLSLNYN